MTKTCVDQSELVNVEAQIDWLTICITQAMARFYVIFSHFSVDFIENINNLIFQNFTFNRLGGYLVFLYCSVYYTD